MKSNIYDQLEKNLYDELEKDSPYEELEKELEELKGKDGKDAEIKKEHLDFVIKAVKRFIVNNIELFRGKPGSDGVTKTETITKIIKEDGKPGKDGRPGSRIYLNIKKPEEATEGDIFLDAKSSELFQFENGEWKKKGALKGKKEEIYFGGGGGAKFLTDLADALISNPTNGQVLQYDGTKWVNATVSSGGGSWGSITGTLSNQTDLQAALDLKADESFAIAMAVAL